LFIGQAGTLQDMNNFRVFIPDKITLIRATGISDPVTIAFPIPEPITIPCPIHDPITIAFPIPDPVTISSPVHDPLTIVFPIPDPVTIPCPIHDPITIAFSIPDPVTISFPVHDPITIAFSIPDPVTISFSVHDPVRNLVDSLFGYSVTCAINIPIIWTIMCINAGIHPAINLLSIKTRFCKLDYNPLIIIPSYLEPIRVWNVAEIRTGIDSPQSGSRPGPRCHTITRHLRVDSARNIGTRRAFHNAGSS
jgi:hypothetical protein